MNENKKSIINQHNWDGEKTDSFISVIMPIRNEEKHLAESLTAIVNQEWEKDNYEILIVDGMSTDETRGIVKEFEAKHKNLKLIDNPQHTAIHALNIGIRHAKGDVIVRVDGHAIVEKDYLQQCDKYLKSTNAECVGGAIESKNRALCGKAIALAMSSTFGVGNALFRTSQKEGYVDCVAYGAYPKEVFDKFGHFDEEFVRCQDDEFFYRLRKLGGKIFMTPKIKSYYYPRAKLKKLWRQYYNYGLWKIRVLQKHPKMMRPRQFVPPTFVLSLITTGLLGAFSKYFTLLFLFIVFTYATASIVASYKVGYKKKKRFALILPKIFCILHISYGLGFLTGLVKYKKFWFKGKQTSHDDRVSLINLKVKDKKLMDGNTFCSFEQYLKLPESKKGESLAS